MTEPHREYSWPLWPLLPLYPYGQRRTIRREIIPGTIWVFEQIQGIFYVVTPVRMTVIRLVAGGLLVYAPVAPTKQCMQLLREIEAEHGAVQYIILPTASGLEHKVFVGPFARRCSQAQVFVSPEQWSFPINLPLSWLGLPLNRTVTLPANPREAPFGDEFDYAILDPIYLNLGSFQETAMLHRATRTLLVTDCVVSIPIDPPDVIQMDPFPLLFHARNYASDPVEDSPANRRRGWHRVALFSFYFRPHALRVRSLWQTLKDARSAYRQSPKYYFGLYPFDWQEHWEKSFESLHGKGRLLVAPVLQTLILNRNPQSVLNWVDIIAQWPIDQIVPCHLDAPIVAGGEDFRRAFSFLRKQSDQSSALDSFRSTLPAEDVAFMQSLDDTLKRRGITPPAQEKV